MHLLCNIEIEIAVEIERARFGMRGVAGFDAEGRGEGTGCGIRDARFGMRG